MYKATKNPNIVIRIHDNATIPKGHRFWKDYEVWLAEGNTPDPAQTDDEIKIDKEAKTEFLAGEKVDVLIPDSSARRKMKSLSRSIKLLHKKVKGTSTGAEDAELDTMSTLADQIDAIYDAADQIKDQIELDVDYDHINSPLWP